MKIKKSTFGIALLIIIISCRDNHLSSMVKFTGMWKLDKYESFDSLMDKWNDAPNRVGYSGYILYDGKGHMGVQLIPPRFKELINKSIDSLNKEELKKNIRLYSTSFEYFGNCKITGSGNSIEHDKLSSSDPREWGTAVTRSFEFRGDTLILTPNELMDGHKTRIRWIKLK